MLKKKYKIDISQLPALNVFTRTVDNISANVDVFLQKNNVILTASDLGTGAKYLLQKKMKVTVVTEDDWEIERVAEENNSFNLDELGVDINGLKQNTVKVEYDEDEELILTEPLKWDEDFDETILLDIDESEFAEEITSDGDYVEINHSEVESFSAPFVLLNILKEFGNCYLEYRDNKLIISSEDYEQEAQLEITEAYNDPEEILNMAKIMKWEKFPIEDIKNIMPIMDKLQPKKYKQAILLENDRMFFHTDSLACEANIPEMLGEYTLNHDIIRILKYAASRKSDVYIARIDDWIIGLNIDGLIAILSVSSTNTLNLMKEANRLKFLNFVQVDKNFISKLNLLAKFNKNATVRIESTDIGYILQIPNMQAFVPGKPVNYGTLLISLDKILTALKITGENTVISVADNEGYILVRFRGNIRIVVEGEHYEYRYQ